MKKNWEQKEKKVEYKKIQYEEILRRIVKSCYTFKGTCKKMFKKYWKIYRKLL